MPNFGEPVTDHPLDSVLLGFIGDIGSLRSTAHLTGSLMQLFSKKASDEYEDYIKNHCQTTEHEDGRTLVTYGPEKAQGYKKKVDRFLESQKSTKLVPRAFLVSLVSQYDVFLGRLVRELFRIQPKLLLESERKLDVKMILDAASISEITDSLIDEEVETLLRKSHHEQFDWLESRFHIPLRKDLKCWSDFVEITQRRNLFVHADGVVSKQYLDTCAKHKVKLKGKVEVGTQFHVNKPYMENAFATFFEIGTKLIQVLWRKHDTKSLKKADHCLNEICVRLMTDEDFTIAKRLLDFACDTLPRYSSEESRMYFTVNRALAYKLSGNNSKCSEFVARQDWSATGEMFKLAHAVLTDNDNELTRLMKVFGPDGYFPEEAYREWPLLRRHGKRKHSLLSLRKFSVSLFPAMKIFLN